MKLHKLIGLSGLFAATIFGTVACKKDYLETRPTNQAEEEAVFSTTQGARAVINGVLRSLYDANDHDEFGMPSINLSYELMSDDLGMIGLGSGWFVRAARYTEARNGNSYVWSTYYNAINNVNFILKHLDEAVGQEEDKNEIRGQALALRAWAYLQLIQTYQFAYGSPVYVVAPSSGRNAQLSTGPVSTDVALGVPLIVEPTKEPTARATMAEVLKQIDDDLLAAEQSFLAGASPRAAKSHLDINVIYGLKARADLFQHRWQSAQDNAVKARSGYTLAQGTELLDGFNSVANREWMWGFVVNAEQNGIYASWMAHMDNRLRAYSQQADGEKAINLTLLRRSSLDSFSIDLTDDDTRYNWWQPVTPNPIIKPGYARRGQMKFYSQSPNSFLADYPMMRVSEMYLIEAEAAALANNTTKAKEVIREFGLTRNPNYAERIDTLVTKDHIVHEIWRQRRLELWGEGFSFFDAKRHMVAFPGVTPKLSINRATASFPSSVIGSSVMEILAGSPFLNFRIPNSELDQNQGCLQNP